MPGAANHKSPTYGQLSALMSDRRNSLERYHPPRRSVGSEDHVDEITSEQKNIKMDGNQGRELGRGRGQHRWDGGRYSQRGRGGMPGRGRGWYRGEGRPEEYERDSASRHYYDDYDEGPANFDLRDELNHSHYDLRRELNQKNLHRSNSEAAAYDLRDELNLRRGVDKDKRGKHQDDYMRGEKVGKEKSSRGRNEEHGSQSRNKLSRPKKNTENFNPCHDAPPMRVVVAPPGLSKYNKQSTTRDVIIVSDLFGDQNDMTYYNKLLNEIKESGIPDQQVWKLWHGDSHLIADDKRNWKESCPTFSEILDKIQAYFDMDIKATRLNWYRNTSEWKPFHHDAAAVKPDKARTQNFTVAVSFGCERDAAFEHAESKTVVAMPQPNGTIYTFGKDVNILWRHGILQVPPEQHSEKGRISIIAWGWIPQTEL